MSRYPELAAKVDAFFERVQARHGADMRCGSGCSHCCHVRLTITEVEAAAIRDEVATWPADRRAALVANAASTAPDQQASLGANATGSAPDRCAALDPGGRCMIYAVRPIMCRSHGAPIRLRDARSLPVVQACRDNFTARGPEAADPDCIIDQQTLSAMVLAVDRDAGNDGARFDLADVIAKC